MKKNLFTTSRKAQSILEYILVAIVFATVGIAAFIDSLRQSAETRRGTSSTVLTAGTMTNDILNDGTNQNYEWPQAWDTKPTAADASGTNQTFGDNGEVFLPTDLEGTDQRVTSDFIDDSENAESGWTEGQEREVVLNEDAPNYYADDEYPEDDVNWERAGAVLDADGNLIYDDHNNPTVLDHDTTDGYLQDGETTTDTDITDNPTDVPNAEGSDILDNIKDMAQQFEAENGRKPTIDEIESYMNDNDSLADTDYDSFDDWYNDIDQDNLNEISQWVDGIEV